MSDGEVEVYRTKSGKEITEADIAEWVAEAEAGYELESATGLPPDLLVETPVPAWVILGIADGAGVLVMASSTLTRSEMRRRLAGFKVIPIGTGPRARVARVPVMANRVLLEFSDFVLIRGASYGAAMSSLAEQWNPPG
jgi:hypothetical protein